MQQPIAGQPDDDAVPAAVEASYVTTFRAARIALQTAAGAREGQQAHTMLRLRDPAPEFDCKAVVECEVVHLEWRQLHDNQNLVLLFDSIEEDCDRPDDLASLWEAAGRFAKLQCKLAVISRDDEFEILSWMDRLNSRRAAQPVGFPIVVDATNQIASQYDMLCEEGPLWGYVIADSNARVRSVSAHSVPFGLNVDELIRCVTWIFESGDDWTDPCP